MNIGVLQGYNKQKKKHQITTYCSEGRTFLFCQHFLTSLQETFVFKCYPNIYILLTLLVNVKSLPAFFFSNNEVIQNRFSIKLSFHFYAFQKLFFFFPIALFIAIVRSCTLFRIQSLVSLLQYFYSSRAQGVIPVSSSEHMISYLTLVVILPSSLTSIFWK